MAEAGFDTLSAARNRKASGLEGGQAEAIVTEISQSKDNSIRDWISFMRSISPCLRHHKS